MKGYFFQLNNQNYKVVSEACLNSRDQFVVLALDINTGFTYKFDEKNIGRVYSSYPQLPALTK